ncbi:MAG: methyltransferase domain-containing protein [Saprospiraceae bacterium]
MLSTPIKYRRDIPFYYDKSDAEFSRDPYEQYANMVTRQMRLHLATEPHPFKAVIHFILENLPADRVEKVADIGCGVGQLISTIAQRFPEANCYGVDYSYQLLKVANDYFVKGKKIAINDEIRGFESIQINGFIIENLQFLLTKAEQLPFINHSLSAICSSFALDRFQEPTVALREIFRCLTVGGRAIICSPLNFQQTAHWEYFYPPQRLFSTLEEIGFRIIKVNETLQIHEPLDLHGNIIHWKVLGIVVEKST